MTPQELSERLTALEARLGITEADARSLRREVLGNGQPGAIGRIMAVIEKLQTSHTRIMYLIGALSGAAGAGVGVVGKSLFGG